MSVFRGLRPSLLAGACATVLGVVLVSSQPSFAAHKARAHHAPVVKSTPKKIQAGAGNNWSAGRSVGNSRAGIGTNGSVGASVSSGFHGYGGTKGGAHTGPSGSSAGFSTGRMGGSAGANTGWGSAVPKGYGRAGNSEALGKYGVGEHHASGGGIGAGYNGSGYGGPNFNNGGMQGVSSGGNSHLKNFDDDHHINEKTGKPEKNDSQTDNAKASGSGASYIFSGKWIDDMHGGSDGNKDKKGKGSSKKTFLDLDDASVGDMPDSDGRGGANARGQFVNKGNRGGGDSGSGQTAQGDGSAGGGANAMGHTFNGGYLNGGDAPSHKPAEAGALKAGALNNGATDPKRDGTARGH